MSSTYRYTDKDMASANWAASRKPRTFSRTADGYTDGRFTLRPARDANERHTGWHLFDSEAPGDGWCNTFPKMADAKAAAVSIRNQEMTMTTARRTLPHGGTDDGTTPTATEMEVDIIGPNLGHNAQTTFVVHKAGCADTKRGWYRTLGPDSLGWKVNVRSLHDVVVEVYNPDEFQYDADKWEDFMSEFTFFPCTGALPHDHATADDPEGDYEPDVDDDEETIEQAIQAGEDEIASQRADYVAMFRRDVERMVEQGAEARAEFVAQLVKNDDLTYAIEWSEQHLIAERLAEHARMVGNACANLRGQGTIAGVPTDEDTVFVAAVRIEHDRVKQQLVSNSILRNSTSMLSNGVSVCHATAAARFVDRTGQMLDAIDHL